MLEDDVRLYGAKGAFLRHIHESLPEIPIEPFFLVSADEDWTLYERQIKDLGGHFLVRSSSNIEDGDRHSAAGIFKTASVHGHSPMQTRRAVADVLRSADSSIASQYKLVNGISEPTEMNLIFHKLSGSNANWSMLRHPHRTNLIFVQGRENLSMAGAKNYVFDEESSNLYDLDFARRVLDTKSVVGIDDDYPDLPKAIEAYQKIEKIVEFQTGFTYQMEFGTSPFSVYQFRPFRKIEHADWDVPSVDYDDFDSVTVYDVCFGTTPPEGIELTLARALNYPLGLRASFMDLLGHPASVPFDEFVSAIAKEWGIGSQEMIYAENVAKSKLANPDVVTAPYEAIRNAVAKLNKGADKEGTLLYQDNIHFQTNDKPIDLLFPNAKCWAPLCSLDFLSHDLFRAAQYYDISLLGNMPMIAAYTGDKGRVYSNGRNAVVLLKHR